MENYSMLEKEVIINLFIEFPWLIDFDYDYYATLKFDVDNEKVSLIVLKNVYEDRYALLYVHYGFLNMSHLQEIENIKTKGIREWANYDRHKQPSVLIIAEKYSEEIKNHFDSTIEIMEYGTKLDNLMTSDKTVFSFFD